MGSEVAHNGEADIAGTVVNSRLAGSVDEPIGDASIPAAPRSPLVRRRRLLSALAVLAAAGSTASLLASTKIKSPADLAADAKPPQPSILTAKVVRQVLATTLVMRGTFARGRQFQFTPTSVATTAHGPGGDKLIVTAVHTSVGAAVAAGAVLMEVSERPIYVLPGQFPAYRDMQPGETGRDIAQLQQGLAGLGFRNSDRSGYFGPSTESAVRRFYQRLGCPPPLFASPATGTADGAAGSPGTSATASPATAAPQAIVPMSEVVFLPTLPAYVAALSAQLGDSVANPLLTFSTGALTLTARLDTNGAPLVKAGMRADIVSESTGFSGTGTIGSIGAVVTPSASNGAAGSGNSGSGDSPYVPLQIVGDGAWPDNLADQDVRITITTASTGTEVLAVPEAAITSTADGRTRVTVVDIDQHQRYVDVTVGVSAAGMVAVTPQGDGQLSAGDLVVVGQ